MIVVDEWVMVEVDGGDWVYWWSVGWLLQVERWRFRRGVGEDIKTRLI